MPVVTPTKSGHNARRWCGHTCVVYAINPGIHARHPIFTTAHACHLLMNAHGHIQIGGMGPPSFQVAPRAPRPHGPFCVSSRAVVVASWVCPWIRIASMRTLTPGIRRPYARCQPLAVLNGKTARKRSGAPFPILLTPESRSQGPHG